MVDLVDDQVGRILDVLDQTGLSENTLVIFTSDHGDYMGNHYFWFKGPFHYEDVINVPLIIRLPGQTEGAGHNSSLVSLVDLAPTMLDLAGIAVPAEMDGKSLRPLFEDNAVSVRDHCLIENRTTRRGLFPRTVVTDKYKGTFYKNQEYGELYDLLADPHEFVNLWNNSEYTDIKEALRQVINKYPERSPDDLSPRIGYA